MSHILYIEYMSQRKHVFLFLVSYWSISSMCTQMLLCVCLCSLLSQVSGHITAFETLEVIEALGQPLGGLVVGSAAIGQSVGAAALQSL